MRATHELNPTQWRKSSYSGGNEGDACVEVADGQPDLIGVRDSKDPHGPVLTFTPAAWSSFVTSVRSAELPSV